MPNSLAISNPIWRRFETASIRIIAIDCDFYISKTKSGLRTLTFFEKNKREMKETSSKEDSEGLDYHLCPYSYSDVADQLREIH